jgi:hypothetical protein
LDRRWLSGYFEFKHANIMLTAVTKRQFSDGPKYQHLQSAISRQKMKTNLPTLNEIKICIILRILYPDCVRV